jgi:hypothetical protein
MSRSPRRFLTFATSLLLLIVLSATSAAQRGAKTYSAENVQAIELERQPCFGACPVYKVVLRPDGTLTYTGIRFVDRTGTLTASFSGQDFNRLVALLKKLNFNSFKARYAVGATDMPTQIVTVRTKSGVKRVEEYGPSAPLGVWTIQTAIDGIVSRARDWKQAPSLLNKGK